MKIKICKDYGVMEEVRKSDEYAELHYPGRITMPSFYHRWEEMDVDIDQLHELIYKGYAIIINC